MRRWLIGTAVLAALWLAAELVAPPWMAGRIEEQVRASTRENITVEAQVASFPVVSRVLATGELPRVSLTITEIRGTRLPVERLAVDVLGVMLDRRSLVSGNVEMTAIESGVFVVRLGTGGLPDAVRSALDAVASGAERLGVRITPRGVAIGLPVIGEVEAELPIGVPCQPDVVVTPDALELRCTFSEIPDWLVRTLS